MTERLYLLSYLQRGYVTYSFEDKYRRILFLKLLSKGEKEISLVVQ